MEYQIVWKRSTNGENAYVGNIRVAGYHWNAIDNKNGNYKGSSLLPQSTLSFKTSDIDEIKRLVQNDVKEFFEKLGLK